MQPHHSDVGGKVGTALASVGSFVVGYVQSDVIFNELVRLFSSCMIAALGAAIGYYVTRLLRYLHEQRNPAPAPPAEPEETKHSARVRKAILRRRYDKKPPTNYGKETI